jgi:hypothetical protein
MEPPVAVVEPVLDRIVSICATIRSRREVFAGAFDGFDIGSGSHGLHAIAIGGVT